MLSAWHLLVLSSDNEKTVCLIKEYLASNYRAHYNRGMLTGFPFQDAWMSPSHVSALFRAAHWNRYVENWSVALDALRRLWQLGKVSELKSPYYEPIKKRANQ